MPCLVIAEINQYLIENHSATNLQNHINSLQIDGLSPSFATKEHEYTLNQLPSITKLPLWLPQNCTYPDTAGQPRYAPSSNRSCLRFLEQDSAKIWQNSEPEELEKHEPAALLRYHFDSGCNKNVAIIAPLAITPVLIALRSIHRFDPYLSDHYLKQFAPVLIALTPTLANELLEYKLAENSFIKASADQVQNEIAAAYLRLERKLHRQYKEHG